jgi:hypothetical protein
MQSAFHNWASRLIWVIVNGGIYYWINTKWFPRMSWISKLEGAATFFTPCNTIDCREIGKLTVFSAWRRNNASNRNRDESFYPLQTGRNIIYAPLLSWCDGFRKSWSLLLWLGGALFSIAGIFLVFRVESGGMDL